MTGPTKADLDRLAADLREQVSALPEPAPEDVERTSRLLAVISLDQARDARQAEQ